MCARELLPDWCGSESKAMSKQYIGDGVYIDFDDGLVLTTEDGIRTTNRIVLEPDVWRALVAFASIMYGTGPQNPRGLMSQEESNES